MSHDAIAGLGKAISTPVATMTVVTVDSVIQAGEILRAAAAHLEDRPWAELAMPCTARQTGALLKAAREMTAPWPPEAGVLFLVDNTPPNRPPEEGVAFWRAMNLQRETWSALNCHLVFLLTLQNQTQLLTVADHLAAWIPIKLDARRPTDARMIQEKQSPEISERGNRNREEARKRLEELERGLAEALANDEEVRPTTMFRRYYLPMMEAALAANTLTRADAIRTIVNTNDVPEADKPQWWLAVCQILLRLYRLDEARTEAERYLAWAEQSRNTQAIGAACNALAEVLQTSGDVADARALLERALDIAEAVYGPKHPNVAICANNLGTVLWDTGDFLRARACFERALTIDEEVYGSNHPYVAIRLNNLGSVLHALGDFAGARTLYERALRISEENGGLNDPETAIRVNNLGLALQELGDLTSARQHFQQALAIMEEVYGPHHPQVAVSVSNLGEVQRLLGNPIGAQAYFERALAIEQAVYGSNHPSVARTVNNLARVFQTIGDLPKARAYFERALAILEKVYGPDHPDVAIAANNLGDVLRELGDVSGARAHFERALAIARVRLGESHPDTITFARNLDALGN